MIFQLFMSNCHVTCTGLFSDLQLDEVDIPIDEYALYLVKPCYNLLHPMSEISGIFTRVTSEETFFIAQLGKPELSPHS